MSFYCGIEILNVPESKHENEPLLKKFDFVVENVGKTSALYEDFKKEKSEGGNSLEHNRCALAKLLRHDETVEYKESVFDLQHAQFLGYPAVLISYEQYSHDHVNFSQQLNQIMYSDLSHLQVILELPMTCNSSLINGDVLHNSNFKDDDHTWMIWNQMHGMLMELCLESVSPGSTNANSCGINNSRLQLALTLTADLPENALEHVQRWITEPLKYVIVPTDLFVTNKLGYPILTKAHQNIFQTLFKINPLIILRAKSLEEPINIHLEYLSHLRKIYENNHPDLKMNGSYEDVLQFPLQPLSDHLDSYTYETFELDDQKYAQYEEAIYYCLLDTSPSKSDDPDHVSLLMVVGAGRGPLIIASFNAAQRANRNIQILAVEKNPFSFIVLKNKLATRWAELPITLIHGDMRYLPTHINIEDPQLPISLKSSGDIKNYKDEYSNPKLESSRPTIISSAYFHKNSKSSFKREIELKNCADIMISELLGSFGDNELSPECLYGAQQYLKEKTGVSIPQEYTSFIEPVMSWKLHSQVHTLDHTDYNAKTNTAQTYSHYEMPFVVNVCRAMSLSTPQPVFTFKHPYNNIENDAQKTAHNDNIKNFLSKQSKKLTFDSNLPVDAFLHGFVGYFEATLYKHVLLSTLPKTHTENMFSWFSIYFPIKTPMFVKKRRVSQKQQTTPQNITLDIWRCRNKTNVWYEWAASVNTNENCTNSVIFSPLHNVNGRSSTISLF